MRGVLCAVWMCVPGCALATVLGGVQGVVHDPQHRPVAGVLVVLEPVKATGAAQRAGTDAEGRFRFPAAPLGDYTLRASHAGFDTATEAVTVQADAAPTLHLQLAVASEHASVTVEGSGASAAGLAPSSFTPTTLVRERDIERTPGADLTNSLGMITSFVPGAYVTHDQLHIRGGHQVSWLIDGVQIPNTNIASNLGPQINPRDIEYLQAARGSYTADLGDRTYGVFDVVPRNGFARDHDAELVVTGGSFGQTDDQVSFGSHTGRFAYYASAEGNRSGYGLAPPVSRAVHDASNGVGGFASLLFNQTPRDQLRLAAQVRRDYFQIPYDGNPASLGNQLYNSSGLRDAQAELDSFTDFTWVHTFSAATVLQLSPFFHYNQADYRPRAGDTPVATRSDRGSTYGGLQASVGTTIQRNTVQGGLYAWGQRDSNLFANRFTDGSYPDFTLNAGTAGGLVEEWFSDTYKVLPGVTVSGGLRAAQFRADVSENAVAPRVGLAVQVPRIGWVFRGFYGRFYQPPPLLTTAGPLLDYAQAQNTNLVPLKGERDEEHQFGVQIPFRGWVLDADTFQTRANNFLDHSNIGESSLFLPVTVDGALIQGWELTLRTPRLPHGGEGHLAYSNQLARQRGAVNGGLVCFPVSSPECDVEPGYTPLDHDQRNTLSVGYRSSLPWRSWASGDVTYGSGFTNGNQGNPLCVYQVAYLPGLTTVDLALGRSFGESATVSVNATNLGNRRVLLDNSLTFGGLHWNDPRMIYGEVRWRFRY